MKSTKIITSLMLGAALGAGLSAAAMAQGKLEAVMQR